MANLRKPSGRKRKDTSAQRLNLIPVLDSVFIFIFFLLVSSNFIKIFEIGSDVPIVSSAPPPKSKKKPLALTLTITEKKIDISTGVPSRVVKSFPKKANGSYDLDQLHSYLVGLKARNPSEQTAILIPKTNIRYEMLVRIMDSIRQINNTDKPVYIKGKDGNEVKLRKLFNNIVFGNLMS